VQFGADSLGASVVVLMVPPILKWRKGLSNFGKLTTYQDYSGDFDLSSVACALKTRPPRSSRQFALVTKDVLS
jgi:hypothetical protein